MRSTCPLPIESNTPLCSPFHASPHQTHHSKPITHDPPLHPRSYSHESATQNRCTLHTTPNTPIGRPLQGTADDPLSLHKAVRSVAQLHTMLFMDEGPSKLRWWPIGAALTSRDGKRGDPSVRGLRSFKKEGIPLLGG